MAQRFSKPFYNSKEWKIVRAYILRRDQYLCTQCGEPAEEGGIKEATLYRWRAKYKGLGKSEAKRLKVLEDENQQLKRLVADKELIIQTLNEILKKNF